MFRKIKTAEKLQIVNTVNIKLQLRWTLDNDYGIHTGNRRNRSSIRSPHNYVYGNRTSKCRSRSRARGAHNYVCGIRSSNRSSSSNAHSARKLRLGHIQLK